MKAIGWSASLVVQCAVAVWPSMALHAQDRPALKPFVGETTAEFLARQKGMPRPPSQAALAPVTIIADPGGHFLTTSRINNTDVRVLIDTGANVVALTRDDARQLGLSPEPREFTAKISTANGIAFAAPVLLREISIGEVTVQNVAAVVMPEHRLPVSLLGMSFLSRLSRYEVSGGKLILNR
jgi:aspartyl protease family protein